jgi:hypothetical protein
MSDSPGFVPLDMLPSPEGVEVLVRDETAAYGYSNIFTVRLRVRLRAPGATTSHERVLEKMGVYEEQVEDARRELLDGFRRQIAPYLERPEFAARLSEHLRNQGERAPRLTRYS